LLCDDPAESQRFSEAFAGLAYSLIIRGTEDRGEVEAEALILVPTQSLRESPQTAPAVDKFVTAERPVLIAMDFAAQGTRALRPEDLGGRDFLSLPPKAQELRARLGAVLGDAARSREQRAQAADLERLLSLSRQVSASLNVEEILFELVASLARRLRVARCSLVLIDEQAGRGMVLATSDDRELHDLEIQLEDYPELQEVIRSREVVIIEDVQNDPTLASVAPVLAAQDVGSLLLYPLLVDGALLGVLSLRADSERGPFAARELAFAATGAHVVGLAVRNARLFERVRAESEKEAELRQAAEAELSELKRFEELYEHVGEGLLLLDRQGCVSSINPVGRELLNRSLSLVGQPLSQLGGDFGAEAVARALKQPGPGLSNLELRVPVRGEERVLAMRVSRLHQGSAVLSFRDVTESKRLADELQKTTDFLENLIESSADAIVASDVRGHIILWNAAAQEITGWSREDAISELMVTKLYPDAWAYEVMRQLRNSEGQGKGRVANLRVDLLSRSGTRIPVSLSAAILYEKELEIATMGIFTDLRPRLQIERKLSRAQERLVRTEQQAMIAGLAGTAAHELNQPLTSVMGYAEILKRREFADERSARAVDIIFRESERMAEIVRKIGRITRFETKSYLGETRIVDLDASTQRSEPKFQALESESEPANTQQAQRVDADADPSD